MRTIIHYLSVCISLFLVFTVSAQLDKKQVAIETRMIGLFDKGTTHQDLIPNISFNNWKSDESRVTTRNEFSMNLRGNYFVADNIGVVAGIHSMSNSTKQDAVPHDLFPLPETKTSNSSYLIELGGQYGHYFGDIPVMGELTFGFGSRTRLIEEEGRDDFSSSAGLLGVQLNISTFLPLGNEGTYVRPFLGYGTFSQNFQDSKVCTNGLFMGATLIRPMTCEDYFCGFKNEGPTRYRQGQNYVQFLQVGGLALGNNLIQSKDNLFSDIEMNSNSYALRFSDYYYFADNFAVGGGFQLTGEKLSDKSDADIIYNQEFQYEFMPAVRGNFPVEGALNDAFLEVGGIFGRTDGQGATNTAGITGWEAGLGYNFVISNHFFVTTLFNYASRTYNYESMFVGDEGKIKRSGMGVMVGLTHDLFSSDN